QMARQRLRLDFLRRTQPAHDLGREFQQVLEEYDRGGLPFERTLTRLSYGRWLLAQDQKPQASQMATTALELARRHAMPVLAADALELLADSAALTSHDARAEARRLRESAGYLGPGRP